MKLLKIKEFIGEIVHCRKSNFQIYIGRPKLNESWNYGNPFEIGINGKRKEVVEKCKRWLVTGESFGNENATETRRLWILNNLHHLKDKILGCWCDYPKEDCHGRILKELSDYAFLNNYHEE
jgi:hypothetical protein